jgi:hypothetical protein
MATVIATITVNFTSNYVGCHRLFWRKTTSGAYTGPVEATPPCTGGGNPCSITFYDVVDTESCAPIEYNGYVQACCEDVTSANGRIPWTVTYTPSATCLPVEITCSAVEVDSLSVIDGGSGYDPLSPPTVTLIGGGYSLLATATAIVGEGSITNLLISVNGSGPGIAPASYVGVAGTNIVGTGTSVTVNVTSLNTLPGPYPNAGVTYINTVTLVSSSNDWTSGDTFELNSASIGGITGPVLIEVGATDEGTIIGFTMVSNGAGYSSQPIVSIDPPLVGDTATASAVMGTCAKDWIVGPNCNNEDYSPFPINVELGQSFNMCFQAGTISSGTLPSDYTSILNTTDCCITCKRVQFQNTGLDTVDVSWVDCNPLNATFKDVISDTVAGGDVLYVCCAVENSWALSSSTDIIVTVFDDCNCVAP